MPDWAIHLIVPLLALLIVSKREDLKYVLLLLPLAVIPDIDTILARHRAVLHNISVPVILLLLGWMIKDKRKIFVIAAVYITSHVFLDTFGGGAVFFYPFYNQIIFVNTSLRVDQADELIWMLNYGSKNYDSGFKYAHGYILDSAGTGAIIFVFLAGIYAAYRYWINREH